MEVKKITEGMTAPQVAEVIDSNFRGIMEETDAKLYELNSKVGICYKSEEKGKSFAIPFYFKSGKSYDIYIKDGISAIHTSNSSTWGNERVDTIEPFKGSYIFTPSADAAYLTYWATGPVELTIVEVSNPFLYADKLLKEELKEDLKAGDTELYDADNFLYFTDGIKPDFKINSDKAVIVTFPSYDSYARLYNKDFKVVKSFTVPASSEYTIPIFYSLVLVDKTLQVVHFTQEQITNGIPILTVHGDGVCSGPLALYANEASLTTAISDIKADIDNSLGVVLSTLSADSQIIPYNIKANKTYKFIFLSGSYSSAYTTNNNVWGENGRIDTISKTGEKEVEFVATEDAKYLSFWQTSEEAHFALGEVTSIRIELVGIETRINEDIKELNKKDSKLYDDDSFLYFANGAKPNFKINSDNAVVVTFPSYDSYARLYNKDFKVVKSFTVPASSEYTIPIFYSLVLVDKTLQVVHFTQEQITNGIPILTVHGDGVCSGRLAPYYYEWVSKQSKANVTGIMDLFPRTSYLPRIATIRKRTPYGYSPNNTPLVLMFISDIHGNNTNVDRFNEWYNTYKEYVDDRINLGDTTTNDLGQYDSTSAKYFAEHDGANILHQVGNHDVVISGTSTNYWKDGDITSKQVFDKFTGLLNKETLGLVFPENAETNGYNYYYKDYVGMGISTKGIRLVMLDTAIENDDYINTQLEWFQSVLNDALSKQYSIVCATHFPPQKVTQLNFKNKGIVTGFAGVEDVVVFKRYIPYSWLNAVDSFIDGGGEFITWISGHVHSDYLGTIEGYERQLSICITTGSPRLYTAQENEPARLDGTITQDAFNHISFDTYYGRISMLRIGYNFDNFGRPIDMICVDYKNKEVIV